MNEDRRRAGDAAGGAGSVRTVSDIDTLKAIADPVRLAILSALMRGLDSDLPVMTVKELAAQLGEPQTKLYRHVKHLEAVGLIKAVASRVVSGIVEQRYQACQSDLMLGAGLTDAEKGSAEAEAAVAAALETYRSQFFTAHRAGLLADAAPEADPAPPAGTAAEADKYRKMVLGMSVDRVTKARAAEIRDRLEQIMADLSDAAEEHSDGEDTVLINVLVGYFSPSGPLARPDLADDAGS